LTDLDSAVLNELRTLPEGLAEIVGRHLAAADRALMEDDVPRARAHVLAARRRAARVAVVREAAGVTAYLAGDYAEAITELRAVRRMTGSDAYLPILADCERGLGNPQKALDMIRGLDSARLDPTTRIELLIVQAGARADLGNVPAAILTLQVPELTRLPRGEMRARLQYAYADLLERDGRVQDAATWLARAAESDVDGVTDAADRLAEEDGIVFIDDGLDGSDADAARGD
jgi:tetratricopeptide (TPR) repeat protein